MIRYGNSNQQKTYSYGTPKPSGKKNVSYYNRNNQYGSDSEDERYKSPAPPQKSYVYARREDYGKPVNTYMTPKKGVSGKLQTP